MPPTAAAAYSSLQDAQKNALTPDAAISAGNDKYGVSAAGGLVDQLRGMTNNLNTAISNVRPSVQGRTSGSLVTNAQQNAIVNNEQQPLMDDLGKVGTQLGDANNAYGRATGLASHYADSLLQTDKQKYDELFGQYNSLAQAEATRASEAEKARQFDATLAEQQAARRASAGSGVGGIGGFSPGGDSGAPAAPSLPQYGKGTTPQSALADAFNGYKPGVKPGYTEQVVIPSIERLLQLNNPNQPSDVIQAAARNLVYNYRKSTFGE